MIIYETTGQIFVFLACIFLGAAIAVVWQITHCVKRKVLVTVGDVVFCIAAGAIIFYGLLWICYGKMRLFCFAGIILGFFLWLKTLGVFIDRLNAWLYTIFKRWTKLFERGKHGQKNAAKDKVFYSAGDNSADGAGFGAGHIVDTTGATHSD